MTDNPTPAPQPDTDEHGITVDALARLMCIADGHVSDGDHPRWDDLSTTPGYGQDEYRKGARFLLRRLHITPHGVPAPQPEVAPDAEPGTPDLERYRRALAEANDYDIVDLEPHDYLDEARAVLAVRDDALTTAQQRAEAAEQRITAAAALHQRRDDHDGPYCGAGCGDWPCATTTALAPAPAQDGDAT